MFVAVFATPFGICAIFNKNINNYFKPKSCNTFHSFQALMRKILNEKASTRVQEHLVSFNMILYGRVLPTSWVYCWLVFAPLEFCLVIQDLLRLCMIFKACDHRLHPCLKSLVVERDIEVM